MALYLIWDIFEKFRAQDTKEQQLYNQIILWEVGSLIALGLWLGLQVVTSTFAPGAVVLAILLILITSLFVIFVFKKRNFYKAAGELKAASSLGSQALSGTK
jgi:hypothetical protein